MSKIILSFSTLLQGGAARVCANLSTPLCDTYDDVILITWVNAPQFYEIDERAKWLCVEKEVGAKSDLKRMRWFRNFVKQERPDLILSFLEPLNLRVLLCTIGLGVKTIVAERNDPRSVNKYWIIGLIEKLIYRRADLILVQTETVKSYFGGVLKNKTNIIYNPVNLPTEMVGKALTTIKKKRIVSVARLIPQKKLDVLIKAFAVFNKTHPNYSLTIYGIGPLKNSLNQLASKLGIEKKVSFPGNTKTIHQDILDAEIMCLVSEREGMSNAMIEAMCLGLPCICTKVSGALDLIEDGVNGFLVDINDIDGLVEKMNILIDTPLLAYKIGNKASELFNILNKDKIYSEWMKLLNIDIK